MKEPFNLHMDVPCAQFTTLKIGGPARFFVRVESEQELAESIAYADEQNLSVFVLGGGSNVLISDKGFDGLVLQVALMGIAGGNASVNERADHAAEGTPNSRASARSFVTASAGEDWDGFVAYCVANNLAGVECLSGIPGFVGGTPVQNVGAYGQEVSETIVSVRCFDRQTKEIITLGNAECDFTYRTSIFNSSMRDRYIVLNVTFALEKDGKPKVTYKDLIDRFGSRQPTLADVRDAVLQIRRSKSMVIDPEDPNSCSAGSFFKNPIISRERLAKLRSKYERMPFFEFGESVKVPAAWLIENAGFHKGFVIGNAGISSNHTLAIINRGGASAAEILMLKTEIQQAVEAKFGISLKPEPVFVGF